MGQSKSKEGKARKKPKGTQPQETSDPSDPNNPKPVSEDNPNGDPNSPVEDDDDDDTSSGDETGGELGDESVIFSKNKQVVTKDDFELLTVIGKGSFGKV